MWRWKGSEQNVWTGQNLQNNNTDVFECPVTEWHKYEPNPSNAVSLKQIKIKLALTDETTVAISAAMWQLPLL